MRNLKKYLIGEPLKSSQIHHEKFSVFRGLPILSSDAISSVSSTAGVAAITSAFTYLLPYKVEITLLIIVIMTIGNLRGISESAKIFSLPTYLFIFMAVLMIIVGLVKYFIFGTQPINNIEGIKTTGDLTLILFLKAFSAGCTALTGVEAISDGVANFKEPSTTNAKRVLYITKLHYF